LAAAYANNHHYKFATKNTVFLNVVVYFNIFLLSFLLLFGKKSVFAQNINRFGISIKFCVF